MICFFNGVEIISRWSAAWNNSLYFCCVSIHLPARVLDGFDAWIGPPNPWLLKVETMLGMEDDRSENVFLKTVFLLDSSISWHFQLNRTMFFFFGDFWMQTRNRPFQNHRGVTVAQVATKAFGVMTARCLRGGGAVAETRWENFDPARDGHRQYITPLPECEV